MADLVTYEMFIEKIVKLLLKYLYVHKGSLY